MRKIRFSAIISLLLIISLLFTSCGWFKKDKGCAHENTSLQGAKAATCSAEGYTGDTVCNDCTAIVAAGSVIPKKAHTFGAGIVTKEPTCMETGITTYNCSVCGTTETEAIATVAHSDKYHDAQDGTHHHTCLNCTLNENTEHNPTDAGIAFAATCTEPAYTKYTCADCKGVYKVYSDTQLALGHQLGSWQLTSDSTCQSSGEKTQSCQREGCSYKNTITIPQSSSHNYVFSHYESAPNCISSGTAVYTCDDCGAPTTKSIPANGIHNYLEQESTGDGWTRKVCSHCGDVISSYNAAGQTAANLTTDSINTDTSLEMSMESAAIQFPQNVVGQITSGSNVSISAGELDDTAKNAAISNVADADEKAALENAPIYDFTVKVDNNVFSDTFSEKVAITVSYDNGDEDADGIVIYYLAENGEIEKITDVVYNAETKEVTFFVEHFSYYAVAYQETQAMRCKRGNHDYQPTGITSTATCYSFGYTLYECSGCYKTTVDDIVEREAHNYGDIIEAKPTCEWGAYSTRICQNPGCGDILNVKFYGATGHTMDAPATCGTASTCTKCNKVLARPLGHDWSAWETIVEATEITNGLRRRWCSICGAEEEATITSTGTIESITYDSYIELFNAVLGDIIGLESGSIEVEIYANDQKLAADVNIMKTSNGYRMSLVATDTRYDVYPDEIDEVYEIEFYYDNGVFVAVNGTDDEHYASDIDALIPMPLDVFKAVAEELHGQMDAYVNVYLEEIKEFLDTYSDIAADEIDEILADMDVPYTYAQLCDTIESIETVYAYLSLKLGYATEAELGENIVLPTANDLRVVLSAFMAASEKDGVTTYTLTAAPILDAVESVLKLIEDHEMDTVGDFIYFLLQDEIKAYDATITSFDAVINHLKTTFPGTFTLADAIDMYAEYAEKNGTISTDAIYDLIDKIALEMSGEEFDSEALINENGNITINELLRQMTGSETYTAEQFYNELSDTLKSMRVGGIYLRHMVVADWIDGFRMILDNSEVTADISISIDAQGRITALSIDHKFEARKYFDPTEDYMTIESVKLAIKHDSNLTVEIPASIKSEMKDVSYSYDKNGNLVISGLDKNIDYDFGILGNASLSFSESLVKDTTLSEEYGYNVYVLKPEYWTDTQWLGEYYYVNGKYYDRDSFSYFRYAEANGTITLDEFIENAENYITINENWQVGYLETIDNTPVYAVTCSLNATDKYYTSYCAIAYQIGTEWMISTDYGIVHESVMNPGYTSYYVNGAVTAEEFYAGIQPGSVMDYGERYSDSSIFNEYSNSYVEIDGSYHKALVANVELVANGKAVSLFAVEVDGEISVITDYDGWYSDPLYVEGAATATLPEYDGVNEYNATLYSIDVDGNITEIRAKCYSLYVKLPTYYVRVNNNAYARLNSSCVTDSFTPDGNETMRLTDGNTLYVMGTTMDNEYGYKYGYTTVYGYAETADGFYIQAAALMNGSTIVEVKYRDVTETKYVDPGDLYDANDYVSHDGNGTYTIASTLINNLKSICTEDGDMFAIEIRGIKTVGDITVDYMYYVGPYMVKPEIDMDGGTGSDERDFWYGIFGNGGSDSPATYDYKVTVNDDGSITLTFANGVEIYNLRYHALDFSVADDLVKDNEMSSQTGLDIYKYEQSYTSSSWSGYYVYQNGKYYNYETENVYDLLFYDDTDFTKNWYISGMYYRFNMVGSGELPADLPVYQTSISFRAMPYNYNGNYYYNTYYFSSMTLYTFFIDGVINVAVDAYTTGESLLTFEDYMPLDEYIESLEIAINENYSWTETINYNGTATTLYNTYVYLYERDSEGNRNEKSYFRIPYILDGNTKKYVSVEITKNSNLVLGGEVTPDAPANAERYERVDTYANGNFTLVEFRWDTQYTDTVYFVKLAGRMYLYSGDSYWYHLNGYIYERMDEWDFNNKSVDKAWVYKVVSTDEYGDEMISYYTEFIPSDAGFAPSGDLIDESYIQGDIISEVLLGYTADGDAIYEVSFYVTDEDATEFTSEVQADGTVFLHKNGVGYLRVTQNGNNYYVRARQVTMADGSKQVFCFVRGAVIRSDELRDEAESELVQINGNKITFSKEFIDAAAASNKNAFYLEFELESKYGGWDWLNFNYYQFESLSMMG